MKRATLLLALLAGNLAAGTSPDLTAAVLKPETVRAWDSYVQLTEKRIESELNSSSAFLRSDLLKPAEAGAISKSIGNGQVYVQKLKTSNLNGRDIEVPSGMIHHWFGSIFIPNVKVADVLNFVRDYDQHHRFFNEVEASKLRSRDGDRFQVFFRFVRKKIVTVHYNTDHTVIYRHHSDGRESSRSFTTRIAEIDDAGSSSEKEKPLGNDNGYLWRLNSYWRFQERGTGVVIECESISLSRSIPWGVGFLIKGFVESVPRESLENTLTSIRKGVGR